MQIKIGIGNVEGKRVNRVEKVNVGMWLIKGCEPAPTRFISKQNSEEAKTENLLGADCD